MLERKFRYNITEIMRLSEKLKIPFNLRSHKVSMVYISPLRKIDKFSGNNNFYSEHRFSNRVLYFTDFTF